MPKRSAESHWLGPTLQYLTAEESEPSQDSQSLRQSPHPESLIVKTTSSLKWSAEKLQLIQIGFEQLDLNKISIRCATENCKSASIPERLGFVKEGTFRESEWLYDRFLDHYSYSQLRSEYLNSVDSDAQNK